MMPFGETVTVHSADTVTDPYSGEASPSWDNATTRDVDGVAVEPRPSGEPLQDARNAVVSGFTLYFEPGYEPTAYDRVTVRGALHQVIGEPADWRSPLTGWHPGVVVQVERVEG